MLAAAMKARVAALANGITPKGARPPFTRRQTSQEAAQWWMEHRYDALGLARIQTMTPLQVAELDAWLAQVVNHPSMQAGRPASGRPMQEIPGVQNVLTRAFGSERKIEGPPVGAEVA